MFSKVKSLFLSIELVLFVFCLCLFFPKNVFSEETTNNIKNLITVDDYLNKVKDQNGLYKNFEEKIISNKLKIREKELITSPSAFVDGGYSANYKKSTDKDLSYNHKDYEEYNMGLQQNTDIGLSGKLYYNINKTTYVNPDPATTNNNSLGKVQIELQQDLLKNSFGKVTRANKSLIENQNMANYYNNRYGLQQFLQNAENTYWNLVIINNIVNVKLETVKQNKEMENYTSKKVKMNLMDQSDELQSRAALELAKLDLQNANDNQKVMILLFNSLVGSSSNELNNKLVDIPWDYLENYKIPTVYNPTAQLKSLEKQVNAIKANSIIDKNKYKPTLNLIANYSLNSEDDGLTNSMKRIDNSDTPTKYIGLSFSTPLNFSAVKDFNESTYKDQNAIKLQYKQQILNDKVTWNQLIVQLNYAQERLKLAKKVERIQDLKLKNEIKRWKNGISSTYQVLQFQTQLTESRLNSLSIANEIFNTISNLKLFQIEDQGNK